METVSQQYMRAVSVERILENVLLTGRLEGVLPALFMKTEEQDDPSTCKKENQKTLTIDRRSSIEDVIYLALNMLLSKATRTSLRKG